MTAEKLQGICGVCVRRTSQCRTCVGGQGHVSSYTQNFIGEPGRLISGSFRWKIWPPSEILLKSYCWWWMRHHQVDMGSYETADCDLITTSGSECSCVQAYFRGTCVFRSGSVVWYSRWCILNTQIIQACPLGSMAVTSCFSFPFWRSFHR